MRSTPSTSDEISQSAKPGPSVKRPFSRMGWFLVLGLAAVVSSKLIADELGKPTRTDTLVSKLVAKMMQSDHFFVESIE